MTSMPPGPRSPRSPTDTDSPEPGVPSEPDAADTEELPAAASPQEDAAEVARLKAEIAELKARLESPPPAARPRRSVATGVRRVAAGLLVMLAALCLVASVIGVWGARTVLNTDRWVATVAPLPSDPPVAAAMAEYTTSQVFEVLDVQRRIADTLPAQAAFLAGPMTDQMRNYTRQTVDRVLRSDRFAEVWETANRTAHEQVRAIVLGESEIVSVAGEEVHIDLLPIVNETLRRLEAELPTLFGRELNLPDVSSGAIPDNLRTIVEQRLGVTLPENFAQFTIYRGDELSQVQNAVDLTRKGVVGLVVVSFVLLALALWVSPMRRRTLVQLGLWLVVWVVAMTAIIRAVKDQLLAEVPEGVYRTGADAAITTVFGGLRERGLQLLWIGVAVAVVAYLCGPGRIPVWLRRQVVRGGRAAGRGLGRAGRWSVARGPSFVRDHLDVLRVAGVVVAVIAALLLASWVGLLVVAVVLAAYELAVVLVARAAGREEAGGASPAPPAEASISRGSAGP